MGFGSEEIAITRELRKDFPLLARMVKPWPGIADVEPLPGDDEEASTDSGAS